MKKTAITVQAPKCTICQKSVYDMEKIQAIDQIWHKTCFCCGAKGTSGGCNKVLTLDKYLDHNGEPFCKTCHSRLFGPKGYGYGVGAGVLCPSEHITSSKDLVSTDATSDKGKFENRNKILSPRDDEGDLNSSSKKLKPDDINMDLASSTASSPRMQVDDNTSILRTSPRPAMETVAEDDDDDGIEVVDELVEDSSSSPAVEENTALLTAPTFDAAINEECSASPVVDENIAPSTAPTVDATTNDNNITQSISVAEVDPAIEVENNENGIVVDVNEAHKVEPVAPSAVTTPVKEPVAQSPAKVTVPISDSSPRRDLSSILGINKDNSAVKLKLGGGAPKCAACQKPVYPAEKVQAIDQIWHVSI